jgi:2-methylisocitrate lyase-like PEP mutase family enzyme
MTDGEWWRRGVATNATTVRSRTMTATAQTVTFRQLLDRPDLIVAPGAYDGITARLVEQAGFPLVYMTGAGTAAARGYPDYGLLTMTEMVENAAVMARSVSVPVLADADTGFGNELNVTRTVYEYEASGVAGIHLEDQVSPKRCGHLDGKQVIRRDRFISLITAAVEARSSAEFIIVARTDAVATDGLDEAVDRANAALDVGADVAFVEALTTVDEVAAVPTRVHGPCLLNIVPGGKTPVRDLAEAASMGYRMAICPGLLLGATALIGDLVLRELAETGSHPSSGKGTVGDFFNRFGGSEWDPIRDRFAVDDRRQAST